MYITRGRPIEIRSIFDLEFVFCRQFWVLKHVKTSIPSTSTFSILNHFIFKFVKESQRFIVCYKGWKWRYKGGVKVRWRLPKDLLPTEIINRYLRPSYPMLFFITSSSNFDSRARMCIMYSTH